MSLVAGVLVAGGVLAVGAAGRGLMRHIARRARRREVPPPCRGAAPLGRLGFGVEIGDVISLGAEELWLEGGWLLSEGAEPVAVVLPMREATLLALPGPQQQLYRLTPLSAGDFGGASSVESGGVRFERARRLPVELEPVGRGSDPPYKSAVLAEYRAPSGDTLWALDRDGAGLAWQGRRVRDDELERWGRA